MAADGGWDRPLLIVPYQWIGDFVRCHSVVKLLKSLDPDRPIDILASSKRRTAGELYARPAQGDCVRYSKASARLTKKPPASGPAATGKYGQVLVMPGTFKAALAPFWQKSRNAPALSANGDSASSTISGTIVSFCPADRPVRQPRPAPRHAAAGGMAAAGTFCSKRRNCALAKRSRPHRWRARGCAGARCGWAIEALRMTTKGWPKHGADFAGPFGLDRRRAGRKSSIRTDR